MRRLILLPLAAILLAACADMAEHDYRQHFPVGVTSHTAVAVIARPEPGAALPAADAAALAGMGREHLRRGAGPVSVTVASADGETAREAAKAFGDMVAQALDVPPGKLVVKLAVGGPQQPDTAVVEVPVWVSDLPDCGEFKWQPTSDWSNRTTSKFGCSIQRNLGQMIQDPGDLVRAREGGGRDGNRSADVLDKYRRGVPTSSPREGGN
jgi:pilus assembly protein CpaD